MNSGSAPSETRIQLSERDLRILRHVGRFTVSQFDILHNLFFKDKGRDAVKSTLRRLCGRGPTYRYLRPVPLYGSRVVYQLTRRGANAVGVSLSRARPLGTQARIERLAILQFIQDHTEHQQRSLISNSKLREHFAIVGHRLPRQRFYVEERKDAACLGFIVVDHGGYEKRIVRKAIDFLERFLQHGWFDEHLRAGQFVVTILTLTEFKARVIRYGLKKVLKERLGKRLADLRAPSRDGWPLPVHVAVIPGLINLVPGKATTKKRKKR